MYWKTLRRATLRVDVAPEFAVLESPLRMSELARGIGKDEKEVRRSLDPKRPTNSPALIIALRAVGKRLVAV